MVPGSRSGSAGFISAGHVMPEVDQFCFGLQSHHVLNFMHVLQDKKKRKEVCQALDEHEPEEAKASVPAVKPAESVVST